MQLIFVLPMSVNFVLCIGPREVVCSVMTRAMVVLDQERHLSRTVP